MTPSPHPHAGRLARPSGDSLKIHPIQAFNSTDWTGIQMCGLHAFHFHIEPWGCCKVTPSHGSGSEPMPNLIGSFPDL
jgi:hypothetical protein